MLLPEHASHMGRQPDIIRVMKSYNYAWSVPASHLAYWNRDKDTALQLWEQSSTRRTDIDWLGRTFAHIVVDTGDSETMIKMTDSNSDQSFVRHAASDRLGRSLLMIAAASANRHIFATLLDHEADTRPHPSSPSLLLDLAQEAGSEPIVRRIIKESIVLPPYYIVATDNAIRAGREDIAQCFLQWLSIEDQDEIDALAISAEIYGMPDLSSKLRCITAPVATPDNAVDDLDQWQFPTLSAYNNSFDDTLPPSQAHEVFNDPMPTSEWELTPFQV